MRLTESGLILATAESCTGGWLGQAVTGISGSSAWYERGFITYSNATKSEMLGGQATTGPAGGTATKPVGTVCLAWAMRQGSVRQKIHLFPGNRDDIRSQAVVTALQGILEILNDAAPPIA